MRLACRGRNLDIKAGGAAKAPSVPDTEIKGSPTTRCNRANPTNDPAEKPQTSTELNGVMGTAGAA